MKNLSNLQEILKMPFALAAKVGPAPFSGRYPTHIYWTIRWRMVDHYEGAGIVRGEKHWHEEQYVGKPNAANAKRLEKLLNKIAWRKMHGEIFCGEFDRKHRLYEVTYQDVQGNPLAGGAHIDAGNLWSAYHPWQGLSDWLHFCTVKQYVKNIGGFRVYSATQVLKQEYIQKFKLWMLENCGKQLKSAQERKAEIEARKAQRLKGAKAKGLLNPVYPKGPYGF